MLSEGYTPAVQPSEVSESCSSPAYSSAFHLSTELRSSTNSCQTFVSFAASCSSIPVLPILFSFYLFLFSMCFKSSSISFALWVQDKGISNYTFNMFSQCKYFFPLEMSFPQLFIFEMSVALSRCSLL